MQHREQCPQQDDVREQHEVRDHAEHLVVEIMNRNSAAMPMISAVTPFSMFSLPSCGPITRSLAIEIGAASAPPRNSNASSLASFIESPVVWKRVPKTPLKVAQADDLLFLDVALTFLPSTSVASRRCSMNTTPMRLAEMALRGLEHLFAGCAVERDADRRALLARARGCVHHLVAGDDDRALEHHRITILVHVDLRAGRRAAIRRHGTRIFEPVFERRDLAQRALHFGGVLHTRQLHVDTVETLPLHDGLGDAERVHTIAQRLDVLGDREIPALANLLFGHHALHRGALRHRGVAAAEIGLHCLDRGTHRLQIRARRKQHAQAVVTLGIFLQRDDSP